MKSLVYWLYWRRKWQPTAWGQRSLTATGHGVAQRWTRLTTNTFTWFAGKVLGKPHLPGNLSSPSWEKSEPGVQRYYGRLGKGQKILLQLYSAGVPHPGRRKTTLIYRQMMRHVFLSASVVAVAVSLAADKGNRLFVRNNGRSIVASSGVLWLK